MKSVFRTLLAALVAVSITTTASIASAEESGDYWWLTQGAEVLPKGTYALDVRLGWPSIDFGIHIPLGAKFELTPFIILTTVLSLGRTHHWHAWLPVEGAALEERR